MKRVRANRSPDTNPALMDDDILRSLHARVHRWLALSLARRRLESDARHVHGKVVIGL